MIIHHLEPHKRSAQFKAGERLAVKTGNNFVIGNLTVFENNPNEFIRISGKDELVLVIK